MNTPNESSAPDGATPETDAAAWKIGYGKSARDPDCVYANFARQLERQRDEARERVRQLEVYRDVANKTIADDETEFKRLEAELENAKAQLNRNEALFSEHADEFTNLHQQLAKAWEEVELWKLNHAAEQNKYASACANMEAMAAQHERLEAQLSALQSPVAPSERAVKAAEETIKQWLPDIQATKDNPDWHPNMYQSRLDGISAIIQRTCFPTGEGVEWAKAAGRACCEFAEHWFRGPASTLPNGTFGENMTAVILKHAPSRPTATQENEDTKRLDWLEDFLVNGKWNDSLLSPLKPEDEKYITKANFRTAIDAARGKGGAT